jgi:hypothetical protein
MTMFFVSILALMEVPPLFGVLFCGAALLLADDLALERSWARILKLRNRVRPILQAVTMASTSMICGGCSADSIEPGSVALPVVYGSDSRQVTSSRPTTTAAGGKGAFRGVDEIERRHDRGERGKAR